MRGVSWLASLKEVCSTELTELVPKICDLFFFCHHIFHLHMSWLNTSLHINYVIPSLWHQGDLNHFNFYCPVCFRAHDVKNAVSQTKKIVNLKWLNNQDTGRDIYPGKLRALKKNHKQRCIYRIKVSPHGQVGDRISVGPRLTALVQTSPVQWVPGLFPGAGAGAWTTHPPSSAEVTEKVQLYIYSPLDFMAFSRVNFTFIFITLVEKDCTDSVNDHERTRSLYECGGSVICTGSTGLSRGKCRC
jgi:hypothetical protein